MTRTPGATNRAFPREDLEALFLVYSLMESDGLTFAAALRSVIELASDPGISLAQPLASVVQSPGDPTTHDRRLRRLAKRYPRIADVFSALRADDTPFALLQPYGRGPARVLVPALNIPDPQLQLTDAELCSGTFG